MNARTFQDSISSRSEPVQDKIEPNLANRLNENIGFNDPSHVRTFVFGQAGRLGLQGFNASHGSPSHGRTIFPFEFGRRGLQRFNNVPTFGEQRQNMNFFDGQGLFGLNVVDRVGQSKHKAIYNHLLLFYGVLIIL